MKKKISLIILGFTFGMNAQITELANGNVGIGTTNPIFKLHIKDPIGGAALGIERGGKLWRFDIQNSGNSLWLGNTDLPSAFEFNNSGSLKILATSGNNNKASLQLTGIGETNSGNGTSSVGGAVISGTADNASFGRFNIGIESWFGIGFKSSFNQKAGIIFDTRQANAYFEGKIGIGTDQPDMKLTVNGNIHAKEVKIDLSVPAPDYVFKDDYPLRNIEEVEQFIAENGHLPEIPSAKQFEQNGVMLAQMNMDLLKKIEELTLYVIRQKKESVAQNEKIKHLENENKEIKIVANQIEELKSRLEKIEQEN